MNHILYDICTSQTILILYILIHISYIPSTYHTMPSQCPISATVVYIVRVTTGILWRVFKLCITTRTFNHSRQNLIYVMLPQRNYFSTNNSTAKDALNRKKPLLISVPEPGQFNKSLVVLYSRRKPLLDPYCQFSLCLQWAVIFL